MGFRIKLSALVLLAVWATACVPNTPEGRAAQRIAKGRSLRDQKDYRKAAVEFRVAAQNMPRDAEPVFELGMTYLQSGQGQQAAQALQKAVSLNPRHAEAQYQLALLKLRSAEPELLRQARLVLADRVADKPSDTVSLGLLALTEVRLGETTSALVHLANYAQTKHGELPAVDQGIALLLAHDDIKTAVEVASAVASVAPNSVDAAVLHAGVLLTSRDRRGADAELARALAMSPGFAPALRLRLRLQASDGDTAGAEKTAMAISKLRDEQSWTAYAQILVAHGKIVEGTAEFQRLLNEHGDRAGLRDVYAGTLLLAGRGQEADAVVADTLKKYPADKAALLKRLDRALDRGDLQSAQRDVQALRDLKFNSALFRFQESRLAGARKLTFRQGDLLAEALRMEPGFLLARLRLAQILIESGRAKNALLLLDAATPADKATAVFLFHRNSALLADKQWEDARRGVDAGLSMERSPGLFYQDAAIRDHKGDLSGARKSIEAGLALVPLDPFGWSLLGDTMRSQGQSTAYLALLRQAVAREPRAVPLQKLLGSSLLVIGDLSGARAAYEAAKTVDGDPEAEREIANVEFRSGDPEAAGKRLAALVEKHDGVDARILMADIELAKGSRDGALADYKQALNLEPSNPTVMNKLAEMMAAKGFYDDALFWGRKALAVAPDSPAILDTIGWTYYRQGKLADAVEFLDRSLRRLDRPVARYHLAAVLIKAGDPHRARLEYATGVRQDPRAQARADVIQLFEGKR